MEFDPVSYDITYHDIFTQTDCWSREAICSKITVKKSCIVRCVKHSEREAASSVVWNVLSSVRACLTEVEIFCINEIFARLVAIVKKSLVTLKRRASSEHFAFIWITHNKNKIKTQCGTRTAIYSEHACGVAIDSYTKKCDRPWRPTPAPLGPGSHLTETNHEHWDRKGSAEKKIGLRETRWRE